MLLCVICWSTSGLFIKLIDWHPMVISCARSAVASVFMVLISGRTMFSVINSAGVKFSTGRIFFTAAFFSAAAKILYVSANKLTTPENAIFLQHSAPVWTALASGIFIGEKPGVKHWISTALVIVGTSFFFVSSLSSGHIAGDTIAVLAGFCFALSIIFLRALKNSVPALALFFSHIISVAAGLPFLFIYPAAITTVSLFAVLFLGIVQIGTASLLYAYAIKHISAVNAALISQIEPVLNPIWIILFTSQIPPFLPLAGGAIIIFAVTLSCLDIKFLFARRFFGAMAAPVKTKENVNFYNENAEKQTEMPFPLFVPLSGKMALVIGGGKIALRRVKTLLKFGCKIDIIAKSFTKGLKILIKIHPELISAQKRCFKTGDCVQKSPFFVITATNCRAVNKAVFEECKAAGILVSVADSVYESSFYFPAVAMHDTIVAGISSGGRDHRAVSAAASRLRKVFNNDEYKNRNT
ncbi:MAG: hypothetical protein Pg6A_16380 [Termitinemataceae bacterium]|nr:MAG: hypothetical protein Pg6A_16380 [Termitinemataceae bacterium]